MALSASVSLPEVMSHLGDSGRILNMKKTNAIGTTETTVIHFHLGMRYPTKGSVMLPRAQAMQATPMTNPLCSMLHISVVMFNGLWNNGSIDKNARNFTKTYPL